MASKQRRVQSPDGTVIGCHLSGAGPPLVLVHGTAADHTRWKPVLGMLAARFTTFAIDRRGRGSSSARDPYAIESEFADITAVIDSIGAEVDVLGHSFGAVCCLEAAIRTTHVRRLVLYEPPLPVGLEIPPPALLGRLQALSDAGEHDAVVSMFLREVVRMTPSEIDLLRAEGSWPARVAAAPTIPRELRIADTYTPAFDRYATLQMPTLLLCGGDSPPFLTEPTRRLRRAICGSRLTAMAGHQHVAMNPAPELFARHINDFLA